MKQKMTERAPRKCSSKVLAVTDFKLETGHPLVAKTTDETCLSLHVSFRQRTVVEEWSFVHPVKGNFLVKIGLKMGIHGWLDTEVVQIDPCMTVCGGQR